MEEIPKGIEIKKKIVAPREWADNLLKEYDKYVANGGKDEEQEKIFKKFGIWIGNAKEAEEYEPILISLALQNKLPQAWKDKNKKEVKRLIEASFANVEKYYKE